MCLGVNFINGIRMEIDMKNKNILLLAGAALIAAKGLDNRLEVTHYSVSSDKLPMEFDNFRISLIADFHCDKTAGLIDAIRNENPDIICAAGDMAHDDGTYEPFLNLLRALVEIAPVYIISGNHDIWRSDFEELVRKCKDIGGRYLRDERVFIEKDGKKIAISGMEDPYYTSASGISKRVSKSLEQLENYDGYEILMFHRANLLDMFSGKGFDLILSGHMHGGQFRIPKVGGVICPKTNLYDKSGIFFPKYFGGEYKNGETTMIVTRGVGNPTILPRLFNRPEICTVILKSNKSEAI